MTRAATRKGMAPAESAVLRAGNDEYSLAGKAMNKIRRRTPSAGLSAGPRSQDDNRKVRVQDRQEVGPRGCGRSDRQRNQIQRRQGQGQRRAAQKAIERHCLGGQSPRAAVNVSVPFPPNERICAKARAQPAASHLAAPGHSGSGEFEQTVPALSPGPAVSGFGKSADSMADTAAWSAGPRPFGFFRAAADGPV